MKKLYCILFVILFAILCLGISKNRNPKARFRIITINGQNEKPAPIGDFQPFLVGTKRSRYPGTAPEYRLNNGGKAAGTQQHNAFR